MVEVKVKEIWPFVYRKEYNVRFFGLENLHPFDSKKWGHIYEVSVASAYETKNVLHISLYKF